MANRRKQKPFSVFGSKSIFGEENSSSFKSLITTGGSQTPKSGGGISPYAVPLYGADPHPDIKASVDVGSVPPFFSNMAFGAEDALDLPRSYVEQIRASRLLYNLNPYVAAITDLKASYPYSNLKLNSPEPVATEFYTQVAFNKKFNLLNFVLRGSLQRKKFGEMIAMGAKKQDGVWPKTGKPRWVWANFILLEPELVEIKKHIIGDQEPEYFLRPNRDMEDLVKRLDSKDPEIEHLQGKLPEEIMEKIRKKDLVPLDGEHVSALQDLTDASALRGTPPYQRLFTTARYETFIRRAQMAQANRYHFPVEMWTLGDLEKKIIPAPGDYQKLRDIITNAIQSPPFSLFLPPIVKYEVLGVKDKLLSIKEDFDYIFKMYMVGMGVSENIILGDSGIFSSADTSSNQAFVRMMKRDRDQMEQWMIYNFFEPLARWNDLKSVKGGTLQPILPTIEWEKSLDVRAEEEEKKTAEGQYKAGILPTEDWLAMTGKNATEIALKLEREIGGVFDDGVRIKAPAIRKKLAASAGATPAPGAPNPGEPSPAAGGGEGETVGGPLEGPGGPGGPPPAPLPGAPDLGGPGGPDLGLEPGLGGPPPEVGSSEGIL